jgi:NAD(P)H dehydrogenase (quinone)
MNTKTVLIVHAHPDPTSLTAQLAGAARSALRAQGHEVIQSDLYAMGWKAVYDERDFPERLDPARLSIAAESGHAFTNGTQPDDIAAEQAKLMAADAVIFQFPLWWFSMPAIMKGWFERVYAYGLAYGNKGAGNTHRYGEGGLAGKRAMLSKFELLAHRHPRHAGLFHLLGEVEVVFGFWAFVLMLAMA